MTILTIEAESILLAALIAIRGEDASKGDEMSTIATYNHPIYNRNSKGSVMQNTDRHNLDDIIEKVRKLRSLTRETGFHTTRSIGMLLANLSPDELVQVSEALHLTPREISR